MPRCKRRNARLGLAILATALLLVAFSGQPVMTMLRVDPVPGRAAAGGWLVLPRMVSEIKRPEPIALTTSYPLTVAAASSSNGPLVGWPVAGRLSQGFGCSPYYTGHPGPGCPPEALWFHDGVDIAAPTGTPVRAAITGTVIFAGPDGSGPACGRYRGYGLGVVVATEAGWQTLYAHLARIDMTVGQTVTPETIIGTVGETGCVTGAHLHFGLRNGETLVDPRDYVRYDHSRRQ